MCRATLYDEWMKKFINDNRNESNRTTRFFFDEYSCKNEVATPESRHYSSVWKTAELFFSYRALGLTRVIVSQKITKPAEIVNIKPHLAISIFPHNMLKWEYTCVMYNCVNSVMKKFPSTHANLWNWIFLQQIRTIILYRKSTDPTDIVI